MKVSTLQGVIWEIDSVRRKLAQKEFDDLRTEITRLRAALEEYAYEGNWVGKSNTPRVYADLWNPSENGWAIARKALEKKP
jgi:hypothetical protein